MREIYLTSSITASARFSACVRWENTGKDIIKCRHANCSGGDRGGGGGAAICITFHPDLNEESRNKLCKKYMDMLVSCHGLKCPFRTYASRWFKAMKLCSKEEVEGFEDRPAHKPVLLADNVSDALTDTNHSGASSSNFYTPPYLLSISDDFLLFEDCTTDGSITRDRVTGGAIKIRDALKSRLIGLDISQIKLTVPDVVTDYCREMNLSLDISDVIKKDGEMMKIPYLLATFGWSICTESLDDHDNNSHAIVKCNMCLAKSRLEFSHSCADDEENVSRKRRRMNPNFQLIDSHRMYCPFKSGFSHRLGVKSQLSGWKVVVSKLMKIDY